MVTQRHRSTAVIYRLFYRNVQWRGRRWITPRAVRDYGGWATESLAGGLARGAVRRRNTAGKSPAKQFPILTTSGLGAGVPRARIPRVLEDEIDNGGGVFE
jgi:hypothetical protein